MSGYTVVPAAERLSFGGVVADASVEVQLVMAVLMAASVAAVALGVLGERVRSGDVWLARIRAGGVLLGLLAASYVLLAGFIGISNVRPTPSLTVLAPGYAEAALAVMLGLLASTLAVLFERRRA